MIRAYIGLGSNLKDPVHQIKTAIQKLCQWQDIRVTQVSSFYSSKPVGIQDQPDFVNAVVAIETSRDPADLLRGMQQIERDQGRVRGDVRWGPRTIDLDLLLYGNATIQTERLCVPHPEMAKRNFVLCPLSEIAPDLALPDGRSVLALTGECPGAGIQKLAPVCFDFVRQAE